MRIEHHYHDPNKPEMGTHVIHTDRAAWNQVPNPVNPAAHIDMVDYLKMLIATPALQSGTGWDQPSNHPDYPGKTKLQVVILEVKRMNDATAISTLGV